MLDENDLADDLPGDDLLPKKFHRLTIRGGVPFEKTKRMPYRNLIHSDMRSPESLEKQKQSHVYGRAMEEKFDAICKTLIHGNVLPWLISCRHAPKNEDVRHRTDFKLRARHPHGYEFFLRVQVKSSHKHLAKYDDRPLKNDGIVLVVINNFSGVDNVAKILDDAFREASKKDQARV